MGWGTGSDLSVGDLGPYKEQSGNVLPIAEEGMGTL